MKNGLGTHAGQEGPIECWDSAHSVPPGGEIFRPSYGPGISGKKKSPQKKESPEKTTGKGNSKERLILYAVRAVF